MLVTNPPLITHKELYIRGKKARGKISRLYLHWSGCSYGQLFDDYHLCIDKDGELYKTCSSLTQRKSHTWRRNTGSIGICLCCGCGAVCYENGSINFGTNPPTQLQIEKTAQVIAVLAMALNLKIGFETVTTHAEAACMDGYGIGSEDADMRWDLLQLPDLPADNTLRPGGVVLRGKALWYHNLYTTRYAHAA